ncbi:TMEM165/GDT1 family protein [Tumidithrix helvetica PCC 7403]|uniref:TMEM165/GDT1 family protein n=1 Tax=Tumidithrix helvetica TaxID=3457545 RepID=UPI003CACCEA9
MLTAFTAGLLLITISEIGDKSFFIAVILAMHHSRRLVFAGAMLALMIMTVLSVWVGQFAHFIPKVYTHYATAGLFLLFGLKLLWDAKKLKAKSGECLGAVEAEEFLEEQEKSQNAFQAGKLKLGKLLSNYPQVAVVLKAFTLTFLAEWGDRTQISTFALAASQNSIGVTLGAILGHGICALLAVIGGRLIACRISDWLVTAIGGSLFLVFSGITLVGEGI